MRRTPRQHSEEAQLDMTPMIDVTFLLLIFFMCTLRFKTLEGRLDTVLPKDIGVSCYDGEPAELLDLIIEVVEEGTRLTPGGELWTPDHERFHYGADRVLNYHLGPLKTHSFDELQSRINSQASADLSQRVLLHVRAGVVQSEVVQVLDTLGASGWTEVTIRGAD